IKRLEKDIEAAVGGQNITSMVGVSGIPGGRSAIFSGNSGPHAASLQVNLVPPTERKLSDQALMQAVRKKIQSEGKYAGISVFSTTGGILNRIRNFGSAAPIDVEVQGYDLEASRDYTRKIASALRDVPGLEDVQVSREENYPELDVVVDREKAGAL